MSKFFKGQTTTSLTGYREFKGAKSEYLEFRPIAFSGKTYRVEIWNHEVNQKIGMIEWYSSFRKYSFFPNSNTVWEECCLDAVTQCLKLLDDVRLHNKAIV